jgi:SAM-dependent methyltransferase
MSGFAADWLALREPADRAAREAGLVEALGAWAAGRGRLDVVDIGCGSGSTLRALAGTLPGARWRMVDDDADLLARALASAAALGAEAEPLRVDLAARLEDALRPAPALVTASAFFDLASIAWIDRFVQAAAAAGAAIYAALSYDGRETWAPPHPDDAALHARFLADMRRDKGFGPALGADAGAYLTGRLNAAGYDVRTASTPWRLAAPEDAALIAALADGCADATGASAEWRTARRGAASVEIGHIDVLALPG